MTARKAPQFKLRETLGLLLSFSLLAACSGQKGNPITAPGVVQFQSPDPEPVKHSENAQVADIQSKKSPKTPTADSQQSDPEGQLDSTYKTLRVKIFPLLSVPPQDPYPSTKNIYLVTLLNTKGFRVSTASGKVLGTFREVSMNSQPKQEALILDGKNISLENIVLKPLDPNYPSIVNSDGGRVSVAYRGDFRIEPVSSETSKRKNKAEKKRAANWSVINDIDLEQYLYSVAPSEMPSTYSPEALKAQAVVARTYALFHAWIARNIKNQNWDVDPSTRFQSYRGTDVEIATVSPLIDATKGMILTSAGKLVEAFFSANSGGYTCSLKECFGGPDRPYIASRADYKNIREKSGGTWKSKVTSAGIIERLSKIKFDIKKQLPHYTNPKDIAGLEPILQGPTGRTLQLGIRATNGALVPLTIEQTKEMRKQFRMQTLWYDLVEVANTNQEQVVTGYGFGHGVGLSQVGAHFFAKDAGWKYDQILKYYYTGVEILTLK